MANTEAGRFLGGLIARDMRRDEEAKADVKRAAHTAAVAKHEADRKHRK